MILTLPGYELHLDIVSREQFTLKELMEAYPYAPVGEALYYEATLTDDQRWPLLRTYGRSAYDAVQKMEAQFDEHTPEIVVSMIGRLLDECRSRSQVYTGQY